MLSQTNWLEAVSVMFIEILKKYLMLFLDPKCSSFILGADNNCMSIVGLARSIWPIGLRIWTLYWFFGTYNRLIVFKA